MSRSAERGARLAAGFTTADRPVPTLRRSEQHGQPNTSPVDLPQRCQRLANRDPATWTSMRATRDQLTRIDPGRRPSAPLTRQMSGVRVPPRPRQRRSSAHRPSAWPMLLRPTASEAASDAPVRGHTRYQGGDALASHRQRKDTLDAAELTIYGWSPRPRPTRHWLARRVSRCSSAVRSTRRTRGWSYCLPGRMSRTGVRSTVAHGSRPGVAAWCCQAWAAACRCSGSM
jgi:hypothetical protein